MTKFEEKLEILPIKIIQHPVGDTKYYAAVHVKTLITQADEEIQEHVIANNNLIDVNTKLAEEIANLKSQLQQQALPVVPSFVADWYEFHMNGTFSAVVTAYAFAGDDKAVVWLGENGGIDLLCKMKLYGYTVEKPQLFYLKSKSLLENEGESEEPDVDELYLNAKGNLVIYKGDAKKFTQAEIDSMETGSYE